jgi:hypothetical protein
MANVSFASQYNGYAGERVVWELRAMETAVNWLPRHVF